MTAALLLACCACRCPPPPIDWRAVDAAITDAARKADSATAERRAAALAKLQAEMDASMARLHAGGR